MWTTENHHHLRSNHRNEDWNVITRTILRLIWQPSLQPAQTVPFGTGPTTFATLPEFPFQPGSSLNAAGITTILSRRCRR